MPFGIDQDGPLYRAYHFVRSWTAAARHGFPAKGFRTVIGITGTNGKTTTVNLVTEMLRRDGRKVGMASTINFRILDRAWTNETHKTTLSRTKLNALLAEMRDEGVEDVVLEVSSHALVQSRVYGIPFTVAAVSNLTPEHLDYHRTMERYREAKELLFAKLEGREGTVSVVNGNDPSAAHFLAHPAATSWVTLTGETAALALPHLPGRDVRIVRADDVEFGPSSTSFVLHAGDEKRHVVMRLLGLFNVENAVLAAAVALSQGVPMETIEEVLEDVQGIPGRLEPIDAGQPFRVLIDYAVTPDSLEKLYATVRRFTEGRVIAVFGACGDRDRAKRPVMGEVGGRDADVVIITNEEPYSEDPQSIIDSICTGVRRTAKREGENFFAIPDRKDAIEKAIELARPGDAIVISGMGNQTSMVWGKDVLPWDEREEVRESIVRYMKQAE